MSISVTLCWIIVSDTELNKQRPEVTLRAIYISISAAETLPLIVYIVNIQFVIRYVASLVA